jgi:hypothetical protein
MGWGMRDMGLKSLSSRLLVHNPSDNNQRIHHLLERIHRLSYSMLRVP